MIAVRQYGKKLKQILSQYRDNKQINQSPSYIKKTKQLELKDCKYISNKFIIFCRAFYKYSKKRMGSLSQHFKNEFDNVIDLLSQISSQLNYTNTKINYLLGKLQSDKPKPSNQKFNYMSDENIQFLPTCLGCHQYFIENSVLINYSSSNIFTLLSDTAQNDEISKQLSALLNSGGGYLLIGQRVNKNKQIIETGMTFNEKLITRWKNKQDIIKNLICPKAYILKMDFIPVVRSHNKLLMDKPEKILIRFTIRLQRKCLPFYIQQPIRTFNFFDFNHQKKGYQMIPPSSYYKFLTKKLLRPNTHHYQLNCSKPFKLQLHKEELQLPEEEGKKYPKSMSLISIEKLKEELEQLGNILLFKKYQFFSLFIDNQKFKLLQQLKQLCNKQSFQIRITQLFPEIHKNKVLFSEAKSKKIYLIEHSCTPQKMRVIGREVNNQAKISDNSIVLVAEKIQLKAVLPERFFNQYWNIVRKLFQQKSLPFLYYERQEAIYENEENLYHDFCLHHHNKDVVDKQSILTYVFFCLLGLKPIYIGYQKKQAKHQKV